MAAESVPATETTETETAVPETATPSPADSPATYTVATDVTITRHTADGDDVFIEQHTTQPDAPITTVIAHEAAEVQKQCLLLAVGAEAAAGSLTGPLREWALEVAKRARAVQLVPVAGATA